MTTQLSPPAAAPAGSSDKPRNRAIGGIVLALLLVGLIAVAINARRGAVAGESRTQQ